MLYLSKLESKLDEALSKETRESLTEWIGHKRKKPLNQNKMTAVEWLEEEIKDLIPNDIGSQLKFKNKVKKAKEIEKEQIMSAFEAAEKDCGKDLSRTMPKSINDKP